MNKLCSICVKNDILCSGCSKKLERGELSRVDVSVSRALNKLSIDSDFIHAFEDEKSVIILVGNDAGKFIGRGGKNTKQLTKLFNKEVRVIEKAENKEMIEKIVRSPIIGINVLYSNGEKYRIRMRRPKQHISTEILSSILGKKVEVVFE